MEKRNMNWEQFQKERKQISPEKLRKQIRKLESFGPSWEVVQTALELGEEPSLCLPFLDRALECGMRFSAEEFLVLIRNLSLSGTELVRRLAFLLEEEPEEDEVLAMRLYLDADTFQAVVRYYRMNLTGLEEAEPSAEWGAPEQGDHEQISEAILRLSMVNVREGVCFLSDALKKGVTFTAGEIIGFVKMLSIRDGELIFRLIRSCRDSFTFGELLEIQDDLPKDTFFFLEERCGLTRRDLNPVSWEEYYDIYPDLRCEEQRKYFLALTGPGPGDEMTRVAILLERQKKGIGKDFLRNMLSWKTAGLKPEQILTLTLNISFAGEHQLLYHLLEAASKSLSGDQLNLMRDLLEPEEYEALQKKFFLTDRREEPTAGQSSKWRSHPGEESFRGKQKAGAGSKDRFNRQEYESPASV